MYILWLTLSVGDLLEGCSQHSLGCLVVATNHGSFCHPQQVQSSLPNPDSIRSVGHNLVFHLITQHASKSKCLPYTECLYVMTSASGILSFVLLCSVTTMVGFLIFVYYTGEWGSHHSVNEIFPL